MTTSTFPSGLATAEAAIAALTAKADPRSRRDLAVLHLLHTLDAPVNAVCRLDLGQVDLAAGRIQIPVDNRPTWVPLPPEVAEALKGWLEARGDRPGNVFTTTCGGRLTHDALSAITDRYELASPGQLRPSIANLPDQPSSPAEDLFQAYLSQHKRSPNTKRSYRNTMNRFADFMEIRTRAEALQRLLSLSEEDANAMAGRFLAHLKARAFSKNSIATKTAALTGFTKYAKSVGAIGWAITFSATGRPRKNLREFVTDKIGPIRDIQGDGPEAQAARIICQLEALKP